MNVRFISDIHILFVHLFCHICCCRPPRLFCLRFLFAMLPIVSNVCQRQLLLLSAYMYFMSCAFCIPACEINIFMIIILKSIRMTKSKFDWLSIHRMNLKLCCMYTFSIPSPYLFHTFSIPSLCLLHTFSIPFLYFLHPSPYLLHTFSIPTMSFLNKIVFLV